MLLRPEEKVTAHIVLNKIECLFISKTFSFFFNFHFEAEDRHELEFDFL